jgi:hypothetical protein
VWTDEDNETDWKVKGIEELGRKVEQHHQLENRPFLQFDSRRLHYNIMYLSESVNVCVNNWVPCLKAKHGFAEGGPVPNACRHPQRPLGRCG